MKTAELLHSLSAGPVLYVRVGGVAVQLHGFLGNPKLAKQGGFTVKNWMTKLEGDASQVFSQKPASMVRNRQNGISLIELIMFIVIVSVALAGILLVMNATTKSSADPLIHKQALAIAEALLEEVELMPFTYCDPDDANAASAVAATGGCAVAANEESTTIGPEAGETRYSATTPYDNVSDYNGFSMAAGALLDITGTPAGPAGYRVEPIVVTNNGMPAAGASPAIAAIEALLIKVTVTGPDNVPVVLEGIRTRYSPNGVP
jgi:MSHA pilin protein MshD